MAGREMRKIPKRIRSEYWPPPPASPPPGKKLFCWPAVFLCSPSRSRRCPAANCLEKCLREKRERLRRKRKVIQKKGGRGNERKGELREGFLIPQSALSRPSLSPPRRRFLNPAPNARHIPRRLVSPPPQCFKSNVIVLLLLCASNVSRQKRFLM